jgi:hypothetical protein
VAEPREAPLTRAYDEAERAPCTQRARRRGAPLLLLLLLLLLFMALRAFVGGRAGLARWAFARQYQTDARPSGARAEALARGGGTDRREAADRGAKRWRVARRGAPAAEGRPARMIDGAKRRSTARAVRWPGRGKPDRSEAEGAPRIGWLVGFIYSPLLRSVRAVAPWA